VEFPAEATDGVADEQYLRNVVDVLYRTAQASSPKFKVQDSERMVAPNQL
jgi:hypothetical protein